MLKAPPLAFRDPLPATPTPARPKALPGQSGRERVTSFS